MNQIEVLAFYPNEETRSGKRSADFLGSMTIKIKFFDIEIRGINVFRKKEFWRFAMPHKEGFDAKQDKWVLYPVFSFTDRERYKVFVNQVREEGIKFVKNQMGEF